MLKTMWAIFQRKLTACHLPWFRWKQVEPDTPRNQRQPANVKSDRLQNIYNVCIWSRDPTAWSRGGKFKTRYFLLTFECVFIRRNLPQDNKEVSLCHKFLFLVYLEVKTILCHMSHDYDSRRFKKLPVEIKECKDMASHVNVSSCNVVQRLALPSLGLC